jgi:hypothetical protein
LSGAGIELRLEKVILHVRGRAKTLQAPHNSKPGGGRMTSLENEGFSPLDTRAMSSIRGGDFGAITLFAFAMVAAMGASFTWGYENLGPVFNEHF